MTKIDYNALSLEMHKKYKWKLTTKSKVPLETQADLATYYSPWVAAPCLAIHKDPSLAPTYTRTNNTIAVISDWTAVLWLWNIGWLASLPVMEWKAILFKHFGNVDAIPIVLDTQDPDEIIRTICNIAPSFGWINLEDIKAPECFYIEEQLQQKLSIPVFHDDQHGTAIVTLAWLINASKLVKKEITWLKIIVQWAWAAAIAVVKLLEAYGVEHVIMFDSTWAIYPGRERMNPYKESIAHLNKDTFTWSLHEGLVGADVFIGLSWQENSIDAHVVSTMAHKPIVFATSNPSPEITPDEAKKWWAYIVATWRSDYPNQINNVLAFPWIFRWIFDGKIPQIETEHKLAAAEAIAAYVMQPTPEEIIPNALDMHVANIVAEAVKSVSLDFDESEEVNPNPKIYTKKDDSDDVEEISDPEDLAYIDAMLLDDTLNDSQAA